jgi:Flp pilus assembly pilin Flp
MTKANGQSMMEYTIIGALVAIVAMGGLALLGNRLNGMFGAMIGKPTPPVVAVHSPSPSINPTLPPAEVIPGTGSTAPVLPSPPPPAVAGDVLVKLSNGTTLNLNVPTNITKSVQTVGANGTLVLLGSSIQSMAEQMLASGEIDEKQASTLMQLANQAHHMAEIQKTLEDTSAKYGSDVNAFKNTPVTIDGKQYANAYEAAQSIGYDDANKRGEELGEFWNLYTSATSATYMWPPELKSVLEYHAQTINNISDSMRVSMRDILVYNAGSPDTIGNMMVDQITNKKAASICEMDNGNQDSGVHCN